MSDDEIRRKACGEKHRYSRRANAEVARARLERDRPGTHYVPYRCPFCHRWHVGRVPSVRTLERLSLEMRRAYGEAHPDCAACGAPMAEHSKRDRRACRMAVR